MALAYHMAEQGGAFLGPSHPNWRLQGPAYVNWVYPLDPDMVADARQAAIVEHQDWQNGPQQGVQNIVPPQGTPPPPPPAHTHA